MTYIRFNVAPGAPFSLFFSLPSRLFFQRNATPLCDGVVIYIFSHCPSAFHQTLCQLLVPPFSSRPLSFTSMKKHLAKKQRGDLEEMHREEVENNNPYDALFSHLLNVNSQEKETYNKCSRYFMVVTLKYLLEECRRTYQASPAEFDGINHPFPNAFIMKALSFARNYCFENPELEMLYGDIKFSLLDASSYWRDGEEYQSWWKNNIERRATFNRFIDIANPATTETKLKKIQK